MADPGQIRRILRRLVENALRHSPGGGTVRMEMSRAEDRIVIAIHDAGMIPAGAGDDRPFRPLDGRDARGGTALGVASVQRLTERMGGALTMARDPDAGASSRSACRQPPRRVWRHRVRLWCSISRTIPPTSP